MRQRGAYRLPAAPGLARGQRRAAFRRGLRYIAGTCTASWDARANGLHHNERNGSPCRARRAFLRQRSMPTGSPPNVGILNSQLRTTETGRPFSGVWGVASLPARPPVPGLARRAQSFTAPACGKAGRPARPTSGAWSNTSNERRRCTNPRGGTPEVSNAHRRMAQLRAFAPCLPTKPYAAIGTRTASTPLIDASAWRGAPISPHSIVALRVPSAALPADDATADWNLDLRPATAARMPRRRGLIERRGRRRRFRARSTNGGHSISFRLNEPLFP